MILSRRTFLASLPAVPLGLAACNTLVPNTTEVAGPKGVTVRSFTVPFNNSHLLIQNDRGILIDSAGEDQAPQIERMMRQSGFDPRNLEAVIVTHGHHDHAGGAPHFRDRFGVPIIAGAGDRLLLAAGRNDHICPTGAFAELRRPTDQAGRYAGYEADILVHRRLDLRARFGIDAQVTVLPGHTHGSLIITAGQEAFVGDLIRGTLLGRGATTHLYMCDLDDNIADIQRVLTRIAPRAERFYMGHFPSTTRAAVQTYLDEQNRLRAQL